MMTNTNMAWSHKTELWLIVMIENRFMEDYALFVVVKFIIYFF